MRSPLCHVLVLSGIPAREEVFSANLCSNRKGSITPAKNAFSTAPPLAVPGLNHRGVDLVFALNSRQVSRYDPSGNEVWTTLSDRAPLPSWSAMTTHSPASMQQIDFPAVTRGAASPAVRPILVAGEDGASILSAGRGVILSSLVSVGVDVDQSIFNFMYVFPSFPLITFFRTRAAYTVISPGIGRTTYSG